MSVWPEEQTLEEFISKSDAGKDMYIAGVPRGLIQKNGSATIGGSEVTVLDLTDAAGYLVSASLSGRNGIDEGRTSAAAMTVVVDGERTYNLTVQLTAQDYYSATSAVSVDTTRTVSTFNPVDDIAVTNATLISNLPIKFKKSLRISAARTSGYINYSAAVGYILDTNAGGG